MSKRLCLFIVAFLQIGMLFAQNNRYFSVDNSVRVDRTNSLDLSQLSVIIPCPLTNQYQTISDLDLHGGALLQVQNDLNQYIRFIKSASELSTIGNVFDLTVSFFIEIKPFVFDFNQIDTIFPYNTSASDYIKYTSNSGNYIVPNNPIIDGIADSIWFVSTDIVDYAERCYYYVSSSYQYQNPLTGVHPLADILANGGGDCGNLSSIYVSLLRNKGIPSRHVQTVRPNRTYHVWTEFFLENYGWIPVDVTFKLLHPENDYFGRYEDNGIVVTRGLYMQLENLPSNYASCVLLQNYKIWCWSNNGGTCNGVVAQHLMNSTEYYNLKSYVNNPDWGAVDGDGFYMVNDTATLIAHPSLGHSFVDWRIQDSILSTDTLIPLVVSDNVEINAYFKRNTYNVVAKPNPEEAGIISGDGTYFYGDTAELEVIPYPGYVFKGWSENDIIIMYDTTINIIVDRNRSLVAEFDYNNSCFEEANNDLMLFPNPARSTVIVRGHDMEFVRIYSDSGLLLKEELVENKNEIKLDFDYIKSSVFFLQIQTTDKKVLFRRLIII